jgi:hypothetical protein
MKQTYKRILVPALAILVVVVAYLMLVFMNPMQGNATDVVEYNVNDSGLTYGSALEAPSPESEPDLIEAWATNESLGYIYKKDLEDAEMPYQPKNPEEAVQLMSDRYMAASFTFVGSVRDQAGVEPSIGIDTVNATLRTIFETYGGEIPFDYLTAEERDSLVQLIPDNENAFEIASSAYVAACQANDKSIPVYESDGTTVIGEFIVG